MASSLEELLAEEGFRGRRSGSRSRTSFKSEPASMPSNPSRNLHKIGCLPGTSGVRIKAERSRSDASRYVPRDELPRTRSGSRMRPRDNSTTRKAKNVQRNDRRSSNDLDSEEGVVDEIEVEGDGDCKDIYTDKAYNSERSDRSLKRDMDMDRRGKGIKVDNDRSGKKQNMISYNSSSQGVRNADSFDNNQRPKLKIVAPTLSNVALDEVAIQALISILIDYAKSFLKDEKLRRVICESCFSSLKVNEIEESESIESKVIRNLEEAADVVEKAVEEVASAKELKIATVKLSMITTLSLNATRDGYTSGIPNPKLLACAHLYLSVLYKLQKKDRVSAKHLLEVFFHSPFLARTIFLPELWDHMFFPHLWHLKVWYDREAELLQNSPSRMRKLELLEKIYNEILNSGTIQFARYYKDWLTEGVEPPSVPSIHIPCLSVQGGSGHPSLSTDSPTTPFSPQSMVSKRLYEAVFSQAHKGKDDRAVASFEDCTRSSNASTAEIKHQLACSSETVDDLEKHEEDGSMKNFTSRQDQGLVFSPNEEWQLVKASATAETDRCESINSGIWQETVGDGHILSESANTNEDMQSFKTLAKSFFDRKHSKDSYEHLNDEALFANIPQDFICPLTGQIFEDPVTLETGQTFEREAIEKWFDIGNKACPVTRKALECSSVPLTNFILKRVIDNWKSKHCSHLLDYASQTVRDSEAYESRQRNETAIFVLEKLLITFSREEGVANAKHLVSLGGVDFLIRRFQFGDLEGKTRVAALLCCCIEADASCRNLICRDIDKQSLFKLLRDKHSTSRRTAVRLLSELICLSRKKDVSLFLSGINTEDIMIAMHILLLYLQSSPPEERPLVAIMLLHFDLLVEHKRYSIYREEAVDAISSAMENSITDEKIREASCRGLLILGGRFSNSGNLLTESSILRLAGFKREMNAEEDDSTLYHTDILEDEEANEEWLKKLSVSLLGNGKRSILDSLSKCLVSGSSDMVKACLIMITWLSSALASLSDAEFQLSAFSALISGLKESLESGSQIEHKVLASMSLLHFCKIPECRILFKTIAEEIAAPLQSLAEETWTAKALYAIIAGEHV